MYYEINVSLNGVHLFATAERSISTHEKAAALYDIFAKRFDESAGYKITVSRRQNTGLDVTDEIIKGV